MAERVVIGGASGFLGQRLAAEYRALGADVVAIGRSPGEVAWGDAEAIRSAVDGASLVIGLSGKSVNSRYTAANRAELVRSRVETTRALGAAIAASARPAPLWVNASTATIYRHADDRPQTESTGEYGTELFSEDIAKAWEAALFEAELPGTRRVALRITIALGDGSALGPLSLLARFGLGGANSDGWWPATPERLAARTYLRPRTTGGRQKFSWVHVDDIVGIVRFAQEHPELEGPVIVGSPNPTDNAGFMRELRKALGVPVGIPSRRWMLELASLALGTEAELILKSRWVLPEKLLAAGYEFRYPDLDAALAQIVAAKRGRRRFPA
jgi:NAD dependent epimerase/dehydratase family enzyme